MPDTGHGGDSFDEFVAGALSRTSVRYSGPLRSNRGVPADLQHAIVTGCGRRVARATWVIVYGPAREPTLDADILFLTRRGHMLFYSTG